ncbi:MAG: hypothetical protein ISF22_08945 [Methanomassiliicoccus sp.]|nr:hypothetical protein [Methanomassiliicoccus sp.]
MRPLSRDRSGIAGILIGIIIVIIIIIAAISLFLIPFRTVHINDQQASPLEPGVQALRMNVTIDAGAIDVRFVNDTSVAASMSVVGERRSGLLGPNDPVNVTWAEAFGGEALQIDSVIKLGRNFGWFSSSDLRCTLNISSQLRTSLNITSSLGTIDVRTIEGVELSNVNMMASAGAIRMSVANGTTVDGPINIETSLGGLDLNWTNVVTTDNASINMKASAGGVRMTILQTDALGSDMAVQTNASLGGIDVTMNIQGNNSARVQSHADLGGVSVPQKTGFNGTDADLTSVNYPAPSNFDVRCNASAGGVNLRLNYSE